MSFSAWFMQRSSRRILLTVILFLNCTASVRADDDADLDAYKIRLTGLWWFSNPTGSFQARGTTSANNSFDLSKDFGFASYSTFSGKVDWRFKRKHHLLVGIFPISSSRTTTLNRTFTFQGQTFDVGTRTSADIESTAYAPGYEYDIIRRNRIILSISVKVFLGNVSAKLSATGEFMRFAESFRARGLNIEETVTRVAVYENPYPRSPLTRDIFIGDYDERYGPEKGSIVRVFAGTEVEKLEAAQTTATKPGQA